MFSIHLKNIGGGLVAEGTQVCIGLVKDVQQDFRRAKSLREKAKHLILSRLIISLTCFLSLQLLDSTLTLTNLLTALEEVPDEQWENLNDWLGVPKSVQDKIDEQCSDIVHYKRESLQHWLRNKPLPSWKCIAWALFVIGQFRALKEVDRKYLKSEAVCMVARDFLVDR